MANPNQKKKVVVIAGPTATGKSDVAARICAMNKGMIVSADSVQAYKGVQIGANKPSAAERKETPHILIDVADHTENYTAGDWREDALVAIQSLILSPAQTGVSIESSRKQTVVDSIRAARASKGFTETGDIMPVVCGGTMMYLTWLVHGMPDALKATDDAMAQAQKHIARFQRNDDFPGAMEFVGTFGEVFANRVKSFSKDDWYRLRRTLEIALTVEQEEDKDAVTKDLFSGERQGSLESLGYDVRCFFLCPDDRMSHTAVIDERCERMLMRGLMTETAELELSQQMPDMVQKAIGYRQTLEYLKNPPTPDGEVKDFNAFMNDFTTATRRYAAQQMKWFRKDSACMFVPVPVSQEKDTRIDVTTKKIQQYLDMPREQYDEKLNSPSEESATAKKVNVDQGKGMKFYLFQRHILKEGSQELKDVFTTAVQTRAQVQAKRRRINSDS